MKNFKTLLISFALLAGTSYSLAASHAGAPMPMVDAKKEMPMAVTADMADGEIRKVDFACLQPGHFDAGMKGLVNVARSKPPV